MIDYTSSILIDYAGFFVMNYTSPIFIGFSFFYDRLWWFNLHVQFLIDYTGSGSGNESPRTDEDSSKTNIPGDLLSDVSFLSRK